MVVRIPLGMQSVPANATKQLLPVRVQPHHSKQAPCAGMFAVCNGETDSPYAEPMQGVESTYRCNAVCNGDSPYTEPIQRQKTKPVPHVHSSSCAKKQNHYCKALKAHTWLVIIKVFVIRGRSGLIAVHITIIVGSVIP